MGPVISLLTTQTKQKKKHNAVLASLPGSPLYEKGMAVKGNYSLLFTLRATTLGGVEARESFHLMSVECSISKPSFDSFCCGQLFIWCGGKMIM